MGFAPFIFQIAEGLTLALQRLGSWKTVYNFAGAGGLSLPQL